MSQKNWYYKDKGEKRCPRCKKTFPLTEVFWNKRRGQPCGSTYCRRCQSEDAVRAGKKDKAGSCGLFRGKMLGLRV